MSALVELPADARFGAGVWSPTAGDRIRIMLDHNGAFRHMLWTTVAKDGSVYLAPHVDDLSEVRKGSGPITGGEVSVKYSEGELVTDPGFYKGPKISFHASGLINLAGDRIWTKPLRGLQGPLNLCRVFFRHPSQSRPVTNIRSRDILIAYPIDDDFPLVADIYVAPAFMTPIYQSVQARRGFNVLLSYKGLKGVGDVSVQIAFWHGVKGTWSDYACVNFVYPAASSPNEG